MLAPIEVGNTVYHCRHEMMWPPFVMTLGLTAAELRSRGDVTEEQYNKLRTWENVCGLQKMSAEKCPLCPYALKDGKAPPPRTRFPPTTRKKGRF